MGRKIVSLLKQTASEWKKHNPLFMGAGISFYVILSVGPLLVLFLFGLGIFFSEQQAAAEIVDQVKGVLGEKPAEVLNNIIKQVTTSSGRFITLMSSIPLIFFGSTMVFFQLKYALNIIFEAKQQSSLKENIRKYSFSFLMLLVMASVLFLLVLKNPILNIFKDYLNDVIPVPWLLFRIFEILFSFVLLTFVFLMVYLILPDKKMLFKDLLAGAVVTTFLFTIVQYLIGINAENTKIDNAYGAIGSFTILILWIFYSSLIFLFGASFTKVIAQQKT
jgi:membrane protein